MRWLRTIGREVFGLFVDDGSFAVLILVWVGLIGLLLPQMGSLPGLEWMMRWRGLLLFGGLGAILVGSAVRYARRGRR